MRARAIGLRFLLGVGLSGLGAGVDGLLGIKGFGSQNEDGVRPCGSLGFTLEGAWELSSSIWGLGALNFGVSVSVDSWEHVSLHWFGVWGLGVRAETLNLLRLTPKVWVRFWGSGWGLMLILGLRLNQFWDVASRAK